MGNTQLSQVEILSEVAARKRLPLVSELLIKWAVSLSLWSHNYKSRKALANLTVEQLRDIGVSPKELDFEVRKNFWTR